MLRSAAIQAARRSRVLVAGATLLTAATAGHGAQAGYQVSVGVIESDNIQRLPSGGNTDTIIEEEIGLTWHQRGSRLDADVDADLSHLNYVPALFGPEVIGNFIGQARYSIVPQMLFWDLADNFGQSSIDPLQAITPANREFVNYAMTGPEMLLPIGGSTLLDVAARYGRVDYQSSALNSNRYSGRLGVIHNLSPLSHVSLNVRDERVSYTNDTVSPDYDNQEAFVRFDAKGFRTTIDADLGVARLRQPGTSPSTFLAHLDLTRRITPSNTVALSFGHEFSDSAASFRVEQSLGGANLNAQTVSSSGTPFTSQYGSLAWNFARNRTSWGLTASLYKDHYLQGGSLNDQRTEIDAHLSRQMTPTMQLSLFEVFQKQKFENVVGNSTQTTTDVRLTWRMGSRVSMFVDYAHATRSSDLPASDFKENRIWLSIGYGRPAETPPGPPTPNLPRAAIYN
jgi:hypothetical protein